MKEFLKRKNIVISLKRYGIDAMGSMAQGLFCTLLIGTILNTLGTQFNIGFLTADIGGTGYTIGGFATAMSGPAMAAAIGYSLGAPGLVLFSLIPVGFATNALGGAGARWPSSSSPSWRQSSARPFPRRRKSTSW